MNPEKFSKSKKIMAIVASIGLSIFILSCSTQQIIVPTQKGNIEIFPIQHGSIVFLINGKSVYVDPSWGAKKYEDLPKPDLVLITDIHPDHMDWNTLGDLIEKDKTHIIAPKAVADKAPDGQEIEVLRNNRNTTFEGIDIQAMPMYNITKERLKNHTKGRGNGYILSFGGKRIYISGDTEDTKEMRALKNIDIAFLCMNLPYTMSVEQAASAVEAFQPKEVYPYHYKGQDGLADVGKFKSLVEKSGVPTKVILRDWY